MSNFNDIISILNNYTSGEFEFRIINQSTYLTDAFEVHHTDNETCDRILHHLNPVMIEEKVEIIETFKKAFINNATQIRKVNTVYEKKTLISAIKSNALPIVVKLSNEQHIPQVNLQVESYQKRKRISYKFHKWKIDKTYRYITYDPEDFMLYINNKYYTLIDLEFEYIG